MKSAGRTTGYLKTIICDDDPIQRDFVRICLEVSAAQNEFTEFGLGQGTLDHLKSHESDLMFLDIDLPYIEGVEVLRQLPEFSDLLVIVVSGGGTIGSVAESNEQHSHQNTCCSISIAPNGTF